jgi:hypothetical protein
MPELWALVAEHVRNRPTNSSSGRPTAAADSKHFVLAFVEAQASKLTSFANLQFPRLTAPLNSTFGIYP